MYFVCVAMDGGDRPDRRMGDDRAGYRRGDRKLLSELTDIPPRCVGQ